MKDQGKMVIAMNALGLNIYGGTVSEKEKARRRKANKRARAQRKANRGR